MLNPMAAAGSTRRVPSPANVPSPGGGAPPMPAVEFVAGSYEHDEIIVSSRPTTTFSAGENGVRVPVNAFGFLRGILLTVSATTAGNSANVAFTADGPFSALGQVSVVDVSGAPLFGPVSGFQAYLISKFGAYDLNGNPTDSPDYVATTGTGATGGSFTFSLWIPIEAVKRTAFCALANRSNAARFSLVYNIAPSSAVYSTAPTTLPTVNVTAVGYYWSDPQETDPLGRPIQQVPDFNGSTQFWTVDPQVAVAATNRIHALNRVGNLVRTIILVQRDASAARAAFTGNVRQTWDGRVMHDTTVESMRRRVRATTNQAVDTGVIVFQYTTDNVPLSGGERKALYLPTTDGTRLEFQFSSAGASGGTMEILTNDITLIG